MWTVWSATEILTSRLPDELAIRTAYIRVFLIGLVLQIFLAEVPAGHPARDAAGLEAVIGLLRAPNDAHNEPA